MPFSWLLVALLAAPQASAAGLKYTKTCNDVDWLPGAVEAARILVSERLSELNPKLADQVSKRVDKGIIFHCVNKHLPGGAAMAMKEKGKVPIIMVMKQPERERADWPYTIFHEILHAADPEDALEVTQELHNRGSFPDAVYGCTYAVRRRVDEGWTRLQTFVYDNWSLADQGIPMKETRCDNCSRPWDQRQMNKFGWLCANGGPFMTDDMKARLPQLEQTYCLINGSHDKCKDKVCAEYNEAFKNAGLAPSQREVMALSGKVTDFLSVAEAFDQKLKGGAGAKAEEAINNRQNALLKALTDAGVVQRCSSDTTAFDD